MPLDIVDVQVELLAQPQDEFIRCIGLCLAHREGVAAIVAMLDRDRTQVEISVLLDIAKPVGITKQVPTGVFI